ncbi:unnamed protein product, partial [Nesidiocoris tenuis]
MRHSRQPRSTKLVDEFVLKTTSRAPAAQTVEQQNLACNGPSDSRFISTTDGSYSASSSSISFKDYRQDYSTDHGRWDVHSSTTYLRRQMSSKKRTCPPPFIRHPVCVSDAPHSSQITSRSYVPQLSSQISQPPGSNDENLKQSSDSKNKNLQSARLLSFSVNRNPSNRRMSGGVRQTESDRNGSAKVVNPLSLFHRPIQFEPS